MANLIHPYGTDLMTTQCVLLQENTSDLHGPLRCETAHVYTVACQLMALKIMKWLSGLAEESGRWHITMSCQ